MSFKGTKGESRIILNGDIIVNEREVATVLYSDILDSDCNLANAELIKDAFNTVTKTGLTSSQLLEQRNELIELIERIKNSLYNTEDSLHSLNVLIKHSYERSQEMKLKQS